MAPIDGNEEAEFKQLKFISIPFKEASLDSPAFRATANHFHNKMTIFEQSWLDKSSEFMKDSYAPAFEKFKNLLSIMITNGHPSPRLFNNGMITNQMYTPVLVQNLSQDVYDLVMNLVENIIGDGSRYSIHLNSFHDNCLPEYKSKRKVFERTQKKYDDLLFQTQAVNTANLALKPTDLMKNSNEVFDAKLKYLEASLDLAHTIAATKLKLDKFIIEVISDIISANKLKLKYSSQEIDLTPGLTEYVENYKKWMDRTSEGARALENDIIAAKKQVFDYVVDRTTPSSDIKEYSIESINSEALISNKIKDAVVKKAPEKAGWLYMKTSAGSPSRTLWVRKWCFIQNSIFGMFTLSPSKTYVEETDKFGVLLTAIRYDPNEGRKFCFEVKIIGNKYSDNEGTSNKELTIVLQSESLKELKSWLTAFTLAQKYVLALNKNSFEYDVAFRRFSPEFSEFASSSITTVDKLITTSSDNTKSLVQLLNIKVSDIDSFNFDNEDLSKIYIQSTMVSTQMSKLAILSHFYQNSNWLPSAAIANIWGVTNWTSYSVLDSSTILKGMTSSSAEDYPSNYSNKMKVSDIEFKSIFFSVDHRVLKYPDLLLLFKFSSFWCPNSRQSFSTTCYVTEHYIYCFMNNMGFICLSKHKLENIESIEIDENDHDLLHFSDANGRFTSVFIYFDDPKVIQIKLKFLIKNRHSKHPKSSTALFSALTKIDDSIKHQKEEEKREKNLKVIDRAKNKSLIDKEEISNSFWGMSKEGYDLLTKIKHLQKDSTIDYANNYDIGSKGLFHIIFGHKSNSFPSTFSLARKRRNNNKAADLQWFNELNPKTGKEVSVRHIFAEFSLFNKLISMKTTKNAQSEMDTMVITQRCVCAIENRYYEVEQDPVYVKFPLCRFLRISVRYSITEPYDPEHQLASILSMATTKSFLNLFYTLEFVESGNSDKVVSHELFHEKLLKRLVASKTRYEYLWLKKVIKYYLERIGNHGKVIKAIKLCGNVAPEKNSINNDKVHINYKNPSKNGGKTFIFYSYGTLLRIILKYFFSKFANFILLIIRGVLNLIQFSSSNFSNINKFAVIGLIFSILINSYLSKKTDVVYWSSKKVNVIFDNLMNNKRNLFKMERLIMINNDELLDPNIFYEHDGGESWNKYNEKMFDDNDFKNQRYEIASQRNKLLVELKLIQSMERELVHDDFKIFLEQEIQRCKLLNESANDVLKNDPKLSTYCTDCQREYDNLKSLLL